MLSRCFAGGRAIVNGELVSVDVIATGGTISAIVSPTEISYDDDAIVDCRELIIAPGFIDLQCNGAFGRDFTVDPNSIAPVAELIAQFGVTAFLPTVVTSPAANRRAAIDAFRTLDPETIGAAPLGLHFEGPMISSDHLGAHPAKHVATLQTDELVAWIDSGAVALVTLAPELRGATDVITRLDAGGVVVSGGHTAMSPTDLAAGRDAGLSYATHLFNAMAPFSHRAPGPIGAVLADDAVVAGIICDGIHIDPTAVRMAWQALGAARTSLVSDASPALGMPHGRMTLAGFEIVHDETGVRLADGTLAGSALALDQAVRNLIEFTGCSLVDAVATVTTTPADLLGLTDRGRIQVGARADFATLDEDANLVATVIGGTTAWPTPRQGSDPRRDTNV